MAITVYRSTDGSAPTLSGTAGDLINLLNKCLVAGYGSKSAAGWTMPYDDGGSPKKEAVFRPGGGVQHYFNVNDNSPNGTSLGKEAEVCGFEVATAVATGTGKFPTDAQASWSATTNRRGVTFRKSSTADGTTRAWTVVADDRTAYVFSDNGDGSIYNFTMGEFYSIYAGTDSYRSHVMGRNIQNSTSSANEGPTQLQAGIATAGIGHYVPRSYTALGGSILVTKFSDTPRGSATTKLAGAGIAPPMPIDGLVHIAPVHVAETSIGVRGRMRGFYNICHPASSFSNGDTITGSGAYSGRTFLVIAPGPATTAYCLDITGAWETN